MGAVYTLNPFADFSQKVPANGCIITPLVSNAVYNKNVRHQLAIEL